MIALALYRYENKIVPNDIVKSLKEHALHSDEMGMYWKDITSGYYWYQAPIETQALLIEVFNEVVNGYKKTRDAKIIFERLKAVEKRGRYK